MSFGLPTNATAAVANTSGNSASLASFAIPDGSTVFVYATGIKSSGAPTGINISDTQSLTWTLIKFDTYQAGSDPHLAASLWAYKNTTGSSITTTISIAVQPSATASGISATLVDGHVKNDFSNISVVKDTGMMPIPSYSTTPDGGSLRLGFVNTKATGNITSLVTSNEINDLAYTTGGYKSSTYYTFTTAPSKGMMLLGSSNYFLYFDLEVKRDVSVGAGWSGPQIRSFGSLEGTNTSTLTVPLPPVYSTGDILFLLIETANQSVTVPGDWTFYDEQGVGTATSTTASRTIIYYKTAGSSESDPVLSGSVNHYMATIMAVTPCTIHLSGKSNNGQTLSTVVLPDITTTENNCLLLAIGTSVTDTNGCNIGSWTNGFVERFDAGNTEGNGGSIYVAFKEQTTAGAVGSTQATHRVASASARFMLALKATGGGGGSPNKFWAYIIE